MMTSETSQKKILTWLITGCSSGFGLAMTRLAQANGHKVIATSRNPSRTPELVEEITRKGGEWAKLDLDDSDCGKVIEDFEARGTAIDVLVNIAGFGMTCPVDVTSEEDARRLMETNYFGPYRLICAAVPHMRKRRSGVVVNFSSGAGLEANHTLGAYGASKAALDGVTRVLHKEMQDFDVRVFIVYLGTFNTPMAQNTAKEPKPIDPEYNGTRTKQYYDILSTGNYISLGDYHKATRAIYEVVVREGVGKGREKEMILPLGIDMAARIDEVNSRLNHAMEVFGDVCNNVMAEDAPQGFSKSAFFRDS